MPRSRSDLQLQMPEIDELPKAQRNALLDAVLAGYAAWHASNQLVRLALGIRAAG